MAVCVCVCVCGVLCVVLCCVSFRLNAPRLRSSLAHRLPNVNLTPFCSDPRPPELSFRPIFSPSTVGLASGKLSNDHDVPLAISSVTRLPSLAVLLHIVREATDELFQVR